jgi:hypothetical protein
MEIVRNVGSQARRASTTLAPGRARGIRDVGSFRP